MCDGFNSTISNSRYTFFCNELKGQVVPFRLGLCEKSHTQKSQSVLITETLKDTAVD